MGRFYGFLSGFMELRATRWSSPKKCFFSRTSQIFKISFVLYYSFRPFIYLLDTVEFGPVVHIYEFIAIEFCLLEVQMS